MTHMPIPPVPAAGDAGPAPQGRDEVARLAELHTRLLDTIEGYDKVLEKAEPDLRRIAEEFRALHAAQAEAVARMLATLGQAPGSDGSFFGTVNRAVVEIRSWFDPIGKNIIDALVDGEKHVLAAFDTAIEASPSPERRGALEAMRSDLQSLLDRHARDG